MIWIRVLIGCLSNLWRTQNWEIWPAHKLIKQDWLDWEEQDILQLSESKVLCSGKKTKLGYIDKMVDSWLGGSTVKEGLGVIIDNKLNRDIETAAERTNIVPGCIRRSIVSNMCKVLIPFYVALARPHLEYCVILEITFI